MIINPLTKFITITSILLAAILCPRTGQAFEPALLIKEDGDALQLTLESMPYTSEGSGVAIYIFEQSDCDPCQQLRTDWLDQLDGIELRHFFYPTNQRSANETAALAWSQDIEEYHAFMDGQLKAKAHDGDETLKAAYESVALPINQVIIPTLLMNGWEHPSLIAPHLFWEVDGQWYAYSGYNKEHFQIIMDRAKTTINQ